MDSPLIQEPVKPLKRIVKIKVNTQEVIFVGFLIVLTWFILLFLVYYQQQSKNNDVVQELNENTLDATDTGERYWIVDQVKPSETISGRINLTLISNSGSYKYFTEINSFGLSHNQEYIALQTSDSIKIVKLIDNSSVSAEIPVEQFTARTGESISWNGNNHYFTLGAVDTQSGNSALWVFSVEGSLYKAIEVNLPETNGGLISAHFDKYDDLILTRTYMDLDAEDTKDDGSPYLESELPIHLSVFDIEGNVVKEVMIRDFDINSTDVYYRWSNDAGFIEYLIFNKGATYDVTKEFLFTKVRIQ